MVMSALYLAIIVITAIVFITPSEVSVITRTGKCQDWPHSCGFLTTCLWDKLSWGICEGPVTSENLSHSLRGFKIVCWHFDALLKEKRTGNKRMLLSTDEFWASYTPKVLSVLFKGIIQRTSRNPLFQLLCYDTSITFRGLLWGLVQWIN